MSRNTKNWLMGIAATLIAALVIGVGTTFASDHDKVTEMYQALPRVEKKLDNLSCYMMGDYCKD